MRNIRWGAVVLGCALISTAAFAQKSGCSTQGPEGSEIGCGGYERQGGNHPVSLTLDWGAAILSDGNANNTPFVLGGTFSYFADDWVALDLSGEYLFDVSGFEGLIGPRFRAPFYAVAFDAGIKAGGLVWKPDGLRSSEGRFVISPQVGMEFTMFDRIPLGLTYALDIPIGADQVINRIFLNVGYKF